MLRGTANAVANSPGSSRANSKYAVPTAPSRRRAATGSPYAPGTRATPAAIRQASSRMAAEHTAASSSSRSAKCR